MRKKLNNLIARSKKVTTSLVVLLVFLMPVFWTVNWGMQVFNSENKRKVFSLSELASFTAQNCSSQSAELLKPFSEPIITVTFDDGWETAYSNSIEILENYCIKSTQYILGDHFNEQQYLSEEQVRSFKALGHELAAHSMTHPDLTILSDENLEWELAESKKLLEQKFGDIQEFATPLGASNAKVNERIKKYFRSSRNTVGDPREGLDDSDINVKSTFDIYNINAFTVRKTTTVEELQALIDYTISRNGWLVITYHQVDDENLSDYAVSPEVLESHMKLIADKRIKNASIGNVLNAIERENETGSR